MPTLYLALEIGKGTRRVRDILDKRAPPQLAEPSTASR